MNSLMRLDLLKLEKDGLLEWTIHFNKNDILIKEYKKYAKLKNIKLEEDYYNEFNKTECH